MTPLLLVNFGGPRDLNEVAPFLQTLLCDKDVVRTPFPQFLHNWLFNRVARKRALKIREDYAEIGGKSPIYFDTEALASALSQKLQTPVYTFHRYLPATHAASLKSLRGLKEIRTLPLFPQFSYATTGSIARFFAPHFPMQLRWIKSYAAHPAFLRAYQERIARFLAEKQMREEEVVLLFSAHGLPRSFIETGDPYESECQQSFQKLMAAFPQALCKLCYQSKFGKGEWLRPYTDETCEQVLGWSEGRKKVAMVPLSFTSDHIETLFEIEKLYLPLIRKKGLEAYRCPALNLEPYWIDALTEILQETNLCSNDLLIRK